MVDLVIKNRRNLGYWKSYILQRIERNKNFVGCVTGPTGSGKSYSALAELEKLDPDFTIENCCFNERGFLNLLNGKVKPLKKGSAIMWDEIQTSMDHLGFQSLQARLLNYVFQTFRHKNYILYVTSPHFSFINKSARMMFHSRMETISINTKNNTCKLKPFLIQVNQKTGKVYEKYLRVHNGQGVVPLTRINVPLPSSKLLKDYERCKTEFTINLNKDIKEQLDRLEKKKGPKPLTEPQKEVLEYLRNGMTPQQIAELKNYNVSNVHQHINWIRKKGYEFKIIREDGKTIGYKVVQDTNI